MVRKRLVFRGTVQGVGFRPAIFRIAASLGLSGYVQNRRSHVVAEVQGESETIEGFMKRVRSDIPSPAHVESILVTDMENSTENTPFAIRESESDAFSFPPIPPDLPLCPECARELLDPANRRFLYPFITCTQCGPRYSIVERTPFDRGNTTMRSFTQCPECLAEYRSPNNRRFHSQTNSCPSCGPRLVCTDAHGGIREGLPLLTAIDTLRRGGIVAVHGIGGFHLAADPRHGEAIRRLRREKDRERKPFALMVGALEEARMLCLLSPQQEDLLGSAVAPIVIATRRDEAPSWLREVSDTETLGIMLPYTPLHRLLFAYPGIGIDYRHLVMTSGNRAGDPIITDPDQARERLAEVADVFLCHDRRIAFPTDDSVLRVGSTTPPVILRRSRGQVPRLITLPSAVQGIALALGGDLKSAPALAKGNDIYLGPFIGDLENRETFRQFKTHIRDVLSLYAATPDVVIHDLHPFYRSSAWAGLPNVPRRAVQHHFAHALSVMAEHGLEEALALCFDGTGYGADGEIWGGEFLHATRSSFTRLGSFAPFPLPGGDEAVLHPPRIALALLSGSVEAPFPGISAQEEPILRAMLVGGVGCPLTTSLGRVFDAAAALVGLVETTSYEGEGPIRLEGLAWRRYRPEAFVLTESDVGDLLPFLPGPGDGRVFLINPRPLMGRLLEEKRRTDAASRALLFHEAIARAAFRGCQKMRESTGLETCVLSGGVFQNLLLREMLVPHLIKDGFEVFLNEAAPPGDGGLAVGQAWSRES